MAENNENTTLRNVYIAGAIGGFCAGVVDLMNHPDIKDSIVNRLSELIIKAIWGSPNTFFALVLVTLLSCLLCWIYTPTNKVDGFSRGLAVFAGLTISSPSVQPPNSSVENNKPKAEVPKATQPSAFLDIFIKTAHATGEKTQDELSKIQVVAPLLPPVQPEITMGEAHISLNGPTDSLFPKGASLVVRKKDTKELISSDPISSTSFTIKREFGDFILEFNVPGYQRIQSSLTLKKEQPSVSYSLKLSESILPLGAQMLLPLEEKELTLSTQK